MLEFTWSEFSTCSSCRYDGPPPSPPAAKTAMEAPRPSGKPSPSSILLGRVLQLVRPRDSSAHPVRDEAQYHPWANLTREGGRPARTSPQPEREVMSLRGEEGGGNVRCVCVCLGCQTRKKGTDDDQRDELSVLSSHRTDVSGSIGSVYRYMGGRPPASRHTLCSASTPPLNIPGGGWEREVGQRT